MICAGSAIHAPRSAWAERLRERALATPVAHDFDELLTAFRTRNEYWQRRLEGVEDWTRIPVLQKSDVDSVPVGDDPTIRPTRTSGTTGVQVTIRNTRREREFRRALLYRPQLFYELPQTVVQVVFIDGDWCAPVDGPPKIFDYGGRRYLTWFAGVAADPRPVMALLKAVRPSLIRGIASGIVRFVERSPGNLESLGVRYVGPGGEYLPAGWRATIATAFGATVLDRYGSTESGAIAWQCPRCGRYHANTDEIVLEPEPDGLLTTPLFVSSQPLLRYRLGDRVRFDAENAQCEIRLPTLTIEAARRDDWIIGAGGERVSPLAFQFEKIPALRAWRLHQAADGSLCLYFDAERSAAVQDALRREVHRAVPGRELRLTAGVWKLRRAGKFKRVSSELATACAAVDESGRPVGESGPNRE